MEAIIAINLLTGQCNISRVEACTTQNSEDHIILYDNKSADTQMVAGDGGSVPLTRRVVAVPFGEKVVLSLIATRETEPIVLTMGVTDDVHVCKMGCGEVQVKLAWTVVPKRKRYHNWDVIGGEILLV
jgi:phosphotransferase system IIB component